VIVSDRTDAGDYELGYASPTGRVHLPSRDEGSTRTRCGLEIGLEKDWPLRPFADRPCFSCEHSRKREQTEVAEERENES
jgi:hypothetical protein